MYIDFDISPEAFRSEYLYQKPKLFKGVVKDIRNPWPHINEIYQRADPTDELFKFRKGPLIPKEQYVEAFQDVGRTRYRLNKAAVYEYLRDGATLIHNRINNEPWVDALARQVARFARAQTIVSGYLAFGADASFRSHWDTRDVFAVQLVGKKHWSISAPNFEMPLYMQQSKDLPHIRPPETPDMEIVIEAGDVLYIPRGWWHNPVPMGCETFHLAIGTFPPNGYDYMEWLMGKVPEIAAFRHNLGSWQEDSGRLKQAAAEMAEVIANPEHYETFMQEFLGDQRTDSALAMEIFGSPHSDGLPANSRLRLNAADVSTLDKGYLIANGVKVNVDEYSRDLFHRLKDTESAALDTLLAGFETGKQEKIRQTVYRLATLDILGVLR